MGIGENIKKFRKAHGMEQRDLANALHISDKTVSSWEVGRTEPKMGMIEKIAEVFGVTKTDIIEGKPYMAFETPEQFEKFWNDAGGGRHPIDLTDEEYTMVVNYRCCDDAFKDTVRRMLAYQSKMREIK